MCGRASLVSARGAKKFTVNTFEHMSSVDAAIGAKCPKAALFTRTSSPVRNITRYIAKKE